MVRRVFLVLPIFASNAYPQIGDLFGKSPTPSHKLTGKIHPTASDELENSALGIHPTPSDEFITPPKMIIERLPFSHLCEIMTQKDPLARFFYETECIKGNAREVPSRRNTGYA